MLVLDRVPESDSNFWEEFWISQFKCWGFNLVNSSITKHSSYNRKSKVPFSLCKSKRVVCFDESYNLIYSFLSTSAAGSSLGVSPITVQQCCRGQHKTTKGLALFYYEDIKNLEYDKLINLIYSRFRRDYKNKKIPVAAIINNKVKKFESYKDCAKFYGIPEYVISRYTKSGKEYKGFIRFKKL